MEVTVLAREAGVGYRGDMLWLPKDQINPHAIRARASVYLGGGNLMLAYWETDKHLIVPRELEIDAAFPIVPYGPTEWEHVAWECTAQSRNASDVAAWAATAENPSGILHLGCGKGKTILSLRRVALEQGPACIVVHTSQLEEQWRERALEFLTLNGRPLCEDDIGRVQGNKEQWDRPLVIVMIQTLSRRRVTAELRRRFKLVVYDECHHLSAPTWEQTASFGYGSRLGLTATPMNTKGTHKLYLLHLGQIFHSDVEQPLIPDCYFISLPGIFDKEDQILDVLGQFSFPLAYGVLGKKQQRNAAILAEVNVALRNDRKILVLSHSKPHCWELHRQIPGSGICVSEIPVKDRIQYLRECKVIFGIMDLAREGLDQADLDTVMVTTPFRDQNMLQQIVGRIQREKGKPPIAIFFEDREIPQCAACCFWLRKHLRGWGYPIRQVLK